MFKSSKTPRLYACEPGIDFPTAVLTGLDNRLKNAPPEDWARITILVNTQRMARRLRELFDLGPPRFLPKIQMLTDLDNFLPDGPLPPSMSGLKRRLELVSLITKLIESQPDIAAQSSCFDLADSLANLIDEMQGEAVTPEDIARLDITDQSGHWARTQQFISIAQKYISAAESAPDPTARQRENVLKLQAHWIKNPPPHPILLVGSTGSRGTTQLLMQNIATLPQGAVILPGFDFSMPRQVWNQMMGTSTGEDHPQFRFLQLTRNLNVSPSDIEPWTEDFPPSVDRNRLVSLALRPAPVTDAWQREGLKLSNLSGATEMITLIEADTLRAEATSIAMRLRQAAECGQKAALVTPDRMLTRQVTAALDRWNIIPDDSAGTPLHLSPPGRFLRHTALLFKNTLDAEALLTLMKHPLTHSGGARNTHQLNTQRLELKMRKSGLPYPDHTNLIACACNSVKTDDTEIKEWATWAANLVCSKTVDGNLPLGEWLTRHLTLSQELAAGHLPIKDSDLWEKQAGQATKAIMDDLQVQAEFGGKMSAGDYVSIINAILSQGKVRDRDAPHPNIMIWGTLEARVQGAELVILASLNDGTWPEPVEPDPWLNRKMRLDAGLLLPERRIGLSAHDFQQAIAAREVWLTRSIRSDDAETVPSRWINRLSNLLSGLASLGGPEAWADMKNRGEKWLTLTRQLDASPEKQKALRPSPCPPIVTRPKKLSVTEIQNLIRDPYAIYAKHSLRLRPLKPLVQRPDALLRGVLSHEIMEVFVKTTLDNPKLITVDNLMQHANHILKRDFPWPAARILWLARFNRAAQWIVDTEIKRQKIAFPTAFEDTANGRLKLSSIGMIIEGRADRIDVDPEGQVLIYDYKTGQPPTKDQQKHFDKQLLIEAAMIEAGAFATVGTRVVRAAEFIGIGSNPKIQKADILDEPPSQILKQLVKLLSSYLEVDKGYTSRRALYEDQQSRDYDQLARFGEWDVTDEPQAEKLL